MLKICYIYTEQIPQISTTLEMSIIHATPIHTGDGDKLPFAYFDPYHEGNLTWICGEDATGKIVSVFKFEDAPEGDDRKVDYMTLEEAITVKNTLISEGWKAIVPPKVTITMPDGSDLSTMNRKEKRNLVRHMKRINNKSNPFRS